MKRAEKAAGLWNWSGFLALIAVGAAFAHAPIAAALIGVVAAYLGAAAFCIAVASVLAPQAPLAVSLDDLQKVADKLESEGRLARKRPGSGSDFGNDVEQAAKASAEAARLRKNGDQ